MSFSMRQPLEVARQSGAWSMESQLESSSQMGRLRALDGGVPLAELFAVVGGEVAAAGANEVELDEVDLPAGELLDDGVDVGAGAGLVKSMR